MLPARLIRALARLHYRIMTKKAHIKLLAQVLSLALAFTFAGSCINAAALPQSDLKEKVAEAVNLFLRDRAQAMAQLRALGDPAIPFVLEILQSDQKPIIPVRLALLSFIAEMQGENSNSALMALFSHNESHVRGFATVELGRRKLERAIPKIVGLLNDEGIYMSFMITDPYREEHKLVRDVAIEALQSITGKTLAKGKSREAQIKAWRRWWQKQQ